ncbi:hypothetical protein [Paracoccus kondratievae]|uniref:Uncharacterized protein n=1 Tax=Paracoccus kondratievae TaxID=135740 RepID=A0AAD3RTC5_9RHOB|nr:hypothetical protein [Paracoccus kondratievae]GLK63494.1 hypothetical protein GCM10017635_09640 [Paracoccus kondratievae]
MTWPTPLIAVAAAVHRLATGSVPHSATQTEAASGPAQITGTPPENGISRRITPDLTARAYRLHNRKKDAAERYLRKHQILDKGA